MVLRMTMMMMMMMMMIRSMLLSPVRNTVGMRRATNRLKEYVHAVKCLLHQRQLRRNRSTVSRLYNNSNDVIIIIIFIIIRGVVRRMEGGRRSQWV